MPQVGASLSNPSIDPSEAVPMGPAFEQAALVTRFLNQTEEEIRSRLAKARLFDRIFLLHRDWMTRITMLELLLALFWGAVGGFDVVGFQPQVVAYAAGSALHLSNTEIYSSVTLHGIRELFGFSQQIEMAIFGLLAMNALAIFAQYKWTP